jgi:hypothetical protein
LCAPCYGCIYRILLQIEAFLKLLSMKRTSSGADL